MFGPMQMQAYLKHESEAPALENISVSRAKFIKLAKAAGMRDPEMQAKISEGLGSSVRIGDLMVSVKGHKRKGK